VSDSVKRDENGGGRDPSTGRFVAGNGGGGRKPLDPKVREMLEAATPDAAKRLIEALDATVVEHYLGQEVGTYVDHRTRIMAAEAILNRLHGKPAQAVTDGEGKAVKLGVVILPAETD
jgi:hypothetical protein